jgi:hypothetical protein
MKWVSRCRSSEYAPWVSEWKFEQGIQIYTWELVIVGVGNATIQSAQGSKENVTERGRVVSGGCFSMH